MPNESIPSINIESERQALSMNVRSDVKKLVGIPEEEPAVLMYHVTSNPVSQRIMTDGFVNVSGRGTLAPITDYERVVHIAGSKIGKYQGHASMITFCLPTKSIKLQQDMDKYGWTVENPLPQNAPRELWNTYNGIAIEYNPDTGEPVKYAKDDPTLSPIYIPPQFILGVAQI